jgi:hypothetical protein
MMSDDYTTNQLRKVGENAVVEPAETGGHLARRTLSGEGTRKSPPMR